MTAWEKLLSCQMYNDFDDDLFQRRVAAKKLFRAYNRTEDDQTETRQKLMSELFKSVGKNVWIEPDFRCEFGKNISIGDDVYINFGCVILDCAEVSIGANTLIGPISVSMRRTMRSTRRNGLREDVLRHPFILVEMYGLAEM